MTELKSFLVALYDALSEAETEAFVHSRNRLLELVESEQVPRDVSVPVYHATNMNISLDVGLAVERTETGTEIYITESSEDDSTLSFNAEVFDLIEEEDIETLDYDDIVSKYPGEFPISTDVGRSDENELESSGESNEGELEESADEEGEQGEQEESRRVDTIDGIAQPAADVLERSGIETVAGLIGQTPEELQEIVSEEETGFPEQTNFWLRAVENAAESTEDTIFEQPVGSINGIGPTYGQRLREAGIETLPDLVQQEPEEIADIVNTNTHTITSEQPAQWIKQAEKQLRMIGRRAEKNRRHEGV